MFVHVCCRQLNMFMMLMQMNPDLLSAMGGGASQISREIERIEKYKELKVENFVLAMHLGQEETVSIVLIVSWKTEVCDYLRLKTTESEAGGESGD